MADRNAALPAARRRPLGGSKYIAKPAHPRLLMFVHDGRIGVVHGFIKKTQKTPVDDLDLARRRMKEMLL
jgi:phage-related protein